MQDSFAEIKVSDIPEPRGMQHNLTKRGAYGIKVVSDFLDSGFEAAEVFIDENGWKLSENKFDGDKYRPDRLYALLQNTIRKMHAPCKVRKRGRRVFLVRVDG